MKEFIHAIVYEPWPWWVGGPLIGIFALGILIIERKNLGVSSSFNYICSNVSPWKFEYFKDMSRAKWQFFFVIGLILGGVILYYVNPAYEVGISEASVETLSELGIEKQKGFVPTELYNFSGSSVVILLAGGFLIGFGARYANGCTAGHAISGVSQLAPASIIATVCFFIGGLIATYFILPYIL